MLILGIETSCDETSVSLVKDGRKVLSNLISSQIAKHAEWGGVIPEIASRMHLEAINFILEKALEESDLSMEQVDAIAVTQGPGLLGCLMIGANTAKSLAWIHKKPLIKVNHLHGHICANFIDSDLEPPFLCLLASGAHTQIIFMKDYEDFEILGETIDDAAGEAFDKVARLMHLPYPGGPQLDKLAQNFHPSTGNPARLKYKLPIARIKDMDFSFSGLKTAVLRLKEKTGEDLWNQDKAEIAFIFQDTVAKTFLEKLLKAVEEKDCHKIVIAGGVAANSRIRFVFQENFSKEKGFELIIPPLKYCTDNAAMIASAGYFQHIRNLDSLHHSSNDYKFEVYSRL
jgi:N6-L-threonylcarbamoyladenine synthase